MTICLPAAIVMCVVAEKFYASNASKWPSDKSGPLFDFIETLVKSKKSSSK